MFFYEQSRYGKTIDHSSIASAQAVAKNILSRQRSSIFRLQIKQDLSLALLLRSFYLDGS